MAPTPQKFREIVFQLLYCNDFEVTEDDDTNAFMMKEYALSNSSMRQAQERRSQIAAKIEEIDKKISEVSSSYSFERIPRVERNVLRLGIFELLHDKTIPAKIVIAESIRLARKFASAEAGSFVNAILDTVYVKGSDAEQIATISEGEATL